MENNQLHYEADDLREAVRIMQEGGVILYPTDTVWGIGCDARNEEAVRRIYAIKHREDCKAMLLLLDAPGKLQGYVRHVPDTAWQFLEVADKPLTLIYPDAFNVAPNLLADDGSVGIRITCEPFSKALCERLHAPVVSTSANISGEPTARNFSQISEEIKNAVDYVVRFRQEDMSEPQPSSIIKVGEGGLFKIIRA